MSGKAILCLILGLLNVADIFYKMITCPNCHGNFLGFEVAATTDYLLNVLLAYILLRAVYKERQMKKSNN